MIGSNVSSDMALSTRLRAMPRVGTLCSVLVTTICCLGFTQIGPCPQTCESDADCTSGVCDTASGTCVGCLEDSDCSQGFCSEANGNACVECVTDAHCNDSNACTTDTCSNAACTHANVADGTDCSAASGCTTGACTDGDCDETPVADGTACDDGSVCTSGDVCDAGDCVGAEVADCCESDADCTAPDTCEDNTCVAPGPRVVIGGCPATANQFDTVNLTATPSDFTAGGTLTFAWSSAGASFNPADAAATVATLNASGSITLTVTVTNVTADPADTEETATDSCTIEAAFTALLTVEAGGLQPARSSIGPKNFGGNDALFGSANQQGVDPDAIATEWTVDAQPAGSGAITFHNSAELFTDFRIGPPAKDGDYVFRLTATNENTSETAFDTVTLQLLLAPELRVADDQSPMRIVMQRGTASVDVNLLYTSQSEAFIEVFDGFGDDPENLITALSVPAGVDATAPATISALGDRETDDPDTHFLDGRITDIVDEGGLVDLDNLNPTPNRNSLNDLVLHTTDTWFESGSNLVPPVIDLFTELGEVDGGGDIIHQGIGADDGFLPHRHVLNGANAIKVADINEDGFDDLIVNNSQIDIYFGAPDIVTNREDADDGSTGWPTFDGPDLVIDGADNFWDFCVGDVDGDGHLDIVTVTDTGANFVEVWLMDGADSVDRNDDPDRTYTADSDNNVDLNLFVFCGDVGTGAGAAGIDDIIAVSEGYDDDASSDASDDGAVFVIYGRENLPNDNDIENDAVTGLTGVNQNGERIFDGNSGAFPAVNDGDRFGTFAALGQWDSGGLDLAVGEGDGTGTVGIYLGGGARINRNPARVYSAPVALPSIALEGGDAFLDDVTGDGNSELVVRSHDLDTVYVVPNGLANTSLNDAQIFKYDTASFQLPLFGGGTAAADLDDDDQVAAGDVDGDGVNDLLIGNNDEDRVIVVRGPITSNIENANDIFRIYEDGDGASYGEIIVFGDVTGDGLVDMMFGDSSNELAIFQGFFGPVP